MHSRNYDCSSQLVQPFVNTAFHFKPYCLEYAWSIITDDWACYHKVMRFNNTFVIRNCIVNLLQRLIAIILHRNLGLDGCYRADLSISILDANRDKGRQSNAASSDVYQYVYTNTQLHKDTLYPSVLYIHKSSLFTAETKTITKSIHNFTSSSHNAGAWGSCYCIFMFN